MDKWIFVIMTIAAAAIAAAILAVLRYRRKMRRLMDSLDAMLESAIDGDFTERVFDESALSAVEAKMTQFLSSCAVSSKNLTREKNKIKSLISDISHQTKTPVANILLYSQLLGEHKLPKESVLCVQALSAQAEKLDFLIGALVKISRLESGIIAVNPQKDAVQTLLDAVMTQIKAKAGEKEIAIKVETAESMAYYDPKWTAEAVYNVLDNAVKYSPRQSVIKIHTMPYELFYRIDITDEGIGIPEEEQSKIFSRFYRLPEVSSQEGVGIGLFLTREILSNAGGYIKVSSKLGQGSTFSIFLPTEKRGFFQNC